MLPIAAMIQQRVWGVVRCTTQMPYLITEMNEVVANWIDTAQPTPLGRPLTEVVPLARGEWVAAITRTIVAGESSAIQRLVAQWPDGRERALSICCLPIFEDESLHPTSVISLIVDIEQASDVEPTADQLLQQVGMSCALLPVPIWIFDARGQLRSVNDATLRLFEVTSLEAFIGLVGSTATSQFTRLQPRITSARTIAKATEDSTIDAVHQAERVNRPPARPSSALRRRQHAAAIRPVELASLRALQRRSVTANQIVSFIHPRTNSELIVESSAAPILDASGNLLGAIFVTLDMTERMLRDGQRDAIISMLGHDLRNPLTPARLLLQQLRQTLDREGDYVHEVEDIDSVLRQLGAIDQLSKDIDAISAVIQGEMAHLPPTCDVVALSQEVANRLKKHHQEVTIVVDANQSPIKGVFSHKHLERAMVILIANAVQRSAPGKVVTIRIRAQRERVKIEVRDHGQPLSAEQLASIREILTRKGAALSKSDGTELDIAIVETILSLYRSQLLVNSTRQGTTFWFSLSLEHAGPAKALQG